MTATFCNVTTGPNTSGYGSRGVSTSRSGSVSSGVSVSSGGAGGGINNSSIPPCSSEPPRRKLSKAELREQAEAAFLAWRERKTTKGK